jgi:hypothetical protein
MTISSETRKAGPFTGNGVTATFPFTFKVFQASDVKVVRANTAAVETILTMGTDYTISLNANQDSTPGGSITLTSPLTLNYLLSATSKVPNTQTMDLTNQGGFYPKVINAAMDRLTVQLQQVALDAANAVKVPLTSTQTGDQLRDSLILAQANSAASAAAAATSATNAATSATAASTSQSAAATSASNASTSATNAASSASSASSSATSASGSASTATTQASNASTSASTATTQASNASTSASNASTSATNAANSATAAAGSATSAANSYTTFNNQYLGGKASDPTLNNTGGALVAGNLYFNTTSSVMRTYSGTAWADVAQGVSTPYQTFSGTGAQTAFTLSSTPGSLGSLEVYVHGVRQTPTTDYTISGTTLTFTTAPVLGTANIFARWISTQAINVPADASVTPAKLANSGYELGMRNRVINGAMAIDQRNNGASVTPTISGQYLVDRFSAYITQTNKLTFQQGTNPNTSSGFSNFLNIASLSAYSVTSTDGFALQQRIEGFNVSDLMWGTANAKPVTLSFQVNSSLSGTFGGAIYNSAANRFYPFSYSIPVANSTTNVSITIPGDTTGTWLVNNGVGMTISFGLGAGSTLSAAAGAWTTSSAITCTGATSLVGTSGATFAVTGIQFEKGSTATPFDYRPYGYDLALCQRYFERIDIPVNQQFANLQATSATAAFGGFTSFKVTKHHGPSVAYSGTLICWTANTGNAGGAITPYGIWPDGFNWGVSSATGLVAGNSTTISATGGAVVISASAEL